ncbi:MAG: type II secretion system minor pseudopilin GspK [Desulforhopalus sp.]
MGLLQSDTRGVRPEEAMETRRSLRRDERGMALLITVMTVSLLVAVTIQFHKTTWQQYLVANNYRTAIQLGAIADSGLNIAVAVLENEGEDNTSDSFLDSWAALDSEPFKDAFSGGNLRLKVVDLSGRLQINSLVQKEGENPGEEQTDSEDKTNTEDVIRQTFLNLLLSGFFPIEDEAEARSIVDALIDWIDEDDQESDLGAESSYYQVLDKPYSCRNGPVRYIEELLLVKGITPLLLFGSGENKGLAEYLTVNGDDGRVNFNTAPLLVIKSFDPQIDDDLLVKLDEYRREKENEESLASVGWHQNIVGWPGDIVINDKLLTITSTYFQITATGEFDTRSRSVVAVAERPGAGEVKLLGIKTE